ncbi:MAG: HEAT repeat domain-containing protein, partial [Blastopirellula sp. JB062]
CHLDRAKLSAEKRAELKDYGAWLTAARNGDQEVKQALAEVDAWADETVAQWYGKDYSQDKSHFAYALSAAWQEDPQAFSPLLQLATDRQQPGIVRASALTQLGAFADQPEMARTVKQALVDPDPQLRSAAVMVTEFLSPTVLPRPEALNLLMARLEDPTRLVRTDAASALAGVSQEVLKLNGKQQAFAQALKELQDSLLRNADQAGALLALGALAETMGDDETAEKWYRAAIRIQPSVTGPRSNLAELLSRRLAPARQRFQQMAASGQRAQARQLAEEVAVRDFEIAHLREEELQNLARDASQLPHVAEVQYRYGLALYQANQLSASEKAIAQAARLQPNSVTFLTALVRLQQKRERWAEAQATIETLRALRPNDPGLAEVQQEILQQRQPDSPR